MTTFSQWVRATLRDEPVLERLAALEHARWAHWQRYVHDRGQRMADGTLVLPADAVARWDRQMNTAFDDLSPEERESDREQVEWYLGVVIETLTRS